MMKLEKAKIYGVDQVGRQNPLNLPRTDDAEGLTVTVGESEIHSDFDCYYPWSDMDEIVDSHGNVFIKIPKFYSKVTKNEDGTFKYQISGVRYSGFDTLFIDGKGNELPYICVGKYEGSGSGSQLYSKSGETVLTNLTLDAFRTACKNNGGGYQQYDFLIDQIIKQLWLAEMATTNSQSVMYGYTNENSAALATGHTDCVVTPSGSDVSNTDGKHAMKYRGIENLWGNVWTLCDGISFDGGKIYVSTNPEDYEAEKITDSYTYQGMRATVRSFITKISPLKRNPLMVFVSESSGDSAATYYCDYHFYGWAGKVMMVGGRWVGNVWCGLWYWNTGCSKLTSGSTASARLCFKPIDGAELA